MMWLPRRSDACGSILRSRVAFSLHRRTSRPLSHRLRLPQHHCALGGLPLVFGAAVDGPDLDFPAANQPRRGSLVHHSAGHDPSVWESTRAVVPVSSGEFSTAIKRAHNPSGERQTAVPCRCWQTLRRQAHSARCRLKRLSFGRASDGLAPPGASCTPATPFLRVVGKYPEPSRAQDGKATIFRQKMPREPAGWGEQRTLGP